MGRFLAVDSVRYPRGVRVICRTARGLEVGEVLASVDGQLDADGDGSVLRGVTTADELLLARLEKNKAVAVDACCRFLTEHGHPSVLMDVEQLFDGQSLYFYFLGEVTPELEAVTSELADIYEAKTQFRKFAQTLTEGCGPGCGTDEAPGRGCGDGGCTVCAVAVACRTQTTR